MATTTHAPPVAPTAHQRLVGGLPVGKSSGMKTTRRTTVGTMSMSLTSENSRGAGSDPGFVKVAYVL